MKRYSVRTFKSIPVSKEKLNRVLEAGRLARLQEQTAMEVCGYPEKTKRMKIEEAAYGQEHVGQAPVIIAACSTNIDYRMPNGQLAYPVDISIAVSFMMLQASQESLGSCIITTFDEVIVREIITAPHSMRVVMLLLVGHPAEETPPIRDRKAFCDVISKEHW